MPGRMFLDLGGCDLGEVLQQDADHLAQDIPRQNIAPGQQIIVWHAGGLQHMRWGIIPVGRVNARGRPVMETLINARSETLFEKSAYEGVERAVVPVSGWYEWTGEKRRKTAWRIAPKEGGLLYFAAITDVWEAPGGMRVPQVATVTCEPNADVQKIHHRMGVLLHTSDVETWLNGSQQSASQLMKPWPVGRLQITKAQDVNWDGP